MTPSTNIPLLNRGVLRLDGPQRISFLEGLITQTLHGLLPGSGVFTALLSPQGRFLYDFFVICDQDCLYLTPEKSSIADLLTLLSRYRLRAAVDFSDESAFLRVVASFDPPSLPGLWIEDPRLAAMGWVGLLKEGSIASMAGTLVSYDQIRIPLGVPDGSRDLKVGKAIILENNYQDLHGISWAKGCYIGQELMARTYHQGMIRKRLLPVQLQGPLPSFGTEIFQDTQKVGTLKSTVISGETAWGLALLQVEAIQETQEKNPLSALEGQVRVIPSIPSFLKKIFRNK